MLKQHRNSGQPVSVEWQYRATPWKSAPDLAPTSVPFGGFPLLQGVDGRVQGSLRRALGNLCLMDLRADQDIADGDSLPILGDMASVFTAVFAQDSSGIFEDAFPFQIQKGNTTYRLWGLVLVHRAVDINLRPWQVAGSEDGWSYDATQEWYAEVDANLATSQRYVSLLVHDDELQEWYWQCLRVPEDDGTHYVLDDTGTDWNQPTDAGGTGTASSYLTLAEGASLNVAVRRKFLYLSSSDGSVPPITIWYDNSQNKFLNPFWQGWHFELMGPQFTEDYNPLTLGTAAAEQSPGYSPTGQVQQAMKYRMVDYYRQRFTVTSKVLVFKTWVWDNVGGNYLILDAKVTQTTDGAKRRYIARQYKHFDFFATLPGTTAGQPPSEPYFRADTQRTRSYFADGVGPLWSATIVNVIHFPRAADREDITDVAGVNIVPTPQNILVTRNELSPSQDEVYNPPSSMLAMRSYGGLMFLASDTRYMTAEGDAPINYEEEKVPQVVVAWSPMHREAYEQFPRANQYFTRQAVSEKTSFVEAGNALFLLGNGPVYRIERLETGLLDIQELPVSLELATRYSYAVIQGFLYVVARDGVYLIEPNQGNITRLSEFDRVHQDYMVTASRISMAYDSQIGAIITHLGRSAIYWWVATSEITYEDDLDAVKVVQLRFGDSEERAVFVGQFGRFWYPRIHEAETARASHLRGTNANAPYKDAFTQFGLPGVDADNTIRAWNAKVTAVLRTASNAAYGNRATIRLTLDRNVFADEDGATFSQYYWTGTILRFIGANERPPLDYAVVVGRCPAANQVEFVEPVADFDTLVAIDDWIAVSPVSMRVVFSTLQDETNSSDPSTRREVTSHMPSIWRLRGYGYTQQTGVEFPLWGVGCVDETAFEDHLPVTRPTPEPVYDEVGFFYRKRAGVTGVPGSRLPRAICPYSLGNPEVLKVYTGEEGNLLWPFFACDASDLIFELWGYSVEGRMTSTDVR